MKREPIVVFKTLKGYPKEERGVQLCDALKNQIQKFLSRKLTSRELKDHWE